MNRILMLIGVLLVAGLYFYIPMQFDMALRNYLEVVP